MYVKEAAWYKKQQRQRVKVRLMQRIGLLFVMLLCVCFGVMLGSKRENSSNVSAQTLSELTKQQIPLVEKIPIDVLKEKAEALQKTIREDIRQEDNLQKPASEDGKAIEQGDSQNGQLLEEIIKAEENQTEKKYLIAIDAGHGGEDEGCSFEGVEEKTINLYLAKELQKKLESMGFEVLLTRNDNEELSLEKRVELANSAKADAFISIHQNSCEESSASGIETWYYASEETDNERLAKLVEQYTILYTKARERGIREVDNLYVIRESDMPACLVETGFLSNPIEREKLQEEVYCEKIVNGIADAVQLFFYPKVMYLTFDDGPVAENTEAVLDILKEKGIKATFFVVGENVERNPKVTRRIVEEGHTIGIHCYHHSYDEIYADADSYLEDFEKAKQAVYEATGVEAKLFRFPGGSINNYNEKVYEAIIEEMTKQGYIYFDWNASLEDAVRNPKPEKLIQNAKESTLGRKKVVMLAHDIVDETVICLEELIESFPEYEMRAIDESVNPIQF